MILYFVFCCTASYSGISQCILLYRIVLCCIVLYRTTLLCIVLCCIVSYCIVFCCFVWTFVWTADKSCSHTDMPVPVDWMESNVTSGERGIQEVVTFLVFVGICTKLLQKKKPKNSLTECRVWKWNIKLHFLFLWWLRLHDGELYASHSKIGIHK